MEKYHQVQSGECLSTIAAHYGFRNYRAIYNHPRNAPLRKKRPNPNILLPGDIIFIPDKLDKQESGSTTQRLSYQTGEGKVHLYLQLQDVDGQPLKNRGYVLKVAERLYPGNTGGAGLIDQEIRVSEQQGELIVHVDEGNQIESEFHFPLEIGKLAPVEEISGIQGRLNSLGFNCGPVSGVMTPRTRTAIRVFQRKYGLKVDGEPNAATKAKLAELHHC